MTRLFDDNPVAAVPSLHGAWSTLVALIIWRWRPRLWPIGVAYALVQQFAVVYLGEHYVADLLDRRRARARHVVALGPADPGPARASSLIRAMPSSR